MRHVHAHEAGERAARVLGRVLHGLRLRAHQVRRRHVGVAEHGVALQLLYHGLILLGGLDGVDAEGHYLHAAQVGPLLREHLVERVGDLYRVAGQGAVAYAHVRYLGKGGLERGQQLALELAVYLVAGIVALDVAAHVGVEQYRVGHAIAVLAEAADGYVHIQADVVVHHAEGHRAGRAVLVAQYLAGIEVVHALVLARLAAKGEAVEGRLEQRAGLFAVQRAVEQAGLAALVEHVLARLGAEVHHLALVDYQHALAVGHGNYAAVGYDVVVLKAAAAEAALCLLGGLGDQHVVRQCVRIEVLLPLAGQRAANGVKSRCNQSHSCLSSRHLLESFVSIFLRSVVSYRKWS